MKCKKCGKDFEPSKGLKHYCSLSCRNSRTFSTESKLKKSIANKNNPKIKKFGEMNPAWKGGKFAYKFECPICGKITYGKNRKTCSWACRSELIRKHACNQLRHGGGKKGIYKGFRLDSTYELAFLIYHLDSGIKIERCKQKIKYFYDGKDRIYTPDFIINGIMYEIKGFYCNKSKEKLKQAKEQGYNIVVITSNEIKPYIRYVEDKYNVKNRIHTLYEDYVLIEKECKFCGKTFIAKTDLVKFCSLTCSAKHNNNLPEVISKKHTASLGKKASSETKMKMSIKRKQRLISSDQKKKTSETMKKFWKNKKETAV